MARPSDTPQGLMPSILDRLIDPDTEGTAWRRGYDLNQLLVAVRRDLEELFNTHPSYIEIPERWPELRQSLLTYGLPDLVSVKLNTPADCERVGEQLGEIIARCEPRLRDVRVHVTPGEEGQEHHLRFHIDGKLNADPAPEVAFETVVELSTGKASIELSRGGA